MVGGWVGEGVVGTRWYCDCGARGVGGGGAVDGCEECARDDGEGFGLLGVVVVWWVVDCVAGGDCGACCVEVGRVVDGDIREKFDGCAAGFCGDGFEVGLTGSRGLVRG